MAKQYTELEESLIEELNKVLFELIEFQKMAEAQRNVETTKLIMSLTGYLRGLKLS